MSLDEKINPRPVVWAIGAFCWGAIAYVLTTFSGCPSTDQVHREFQKYQHPVIEKKFTTRHGTITFRTNKNADRYIDEAVYFIEQTRAALTETEKLNLYLGADKNKDNVISTQEAKDVRNIIRNNY